MATSISEHRNAGKAFAASGHPQVTATACRILRAGGNAFDAVVAAGFAASILEPALTSLGGGGFLLARTAVGTATLFDFFVDTPGRDLPDKTREPHFIPVTVRFPSSDQIFNVGMGSVAAPGNLAGFLHVHRKLGGLPLSAVLQPAIELARDGAEINEQQAYFLRLLEPIMTLTPAAKALYAPAGRLLQMGEKLHNPQLAEFLAALPAAVRGTDATMHPFYHGALAQTIEQDMQAGQGLLSAADLAAYQVLEREPLQIAYRGHTLLTNPGPSFGGRMLSLSLQLLEAAELQACEFGSPRQLAALAAAQETASQCRSGYLDGTLEDAVLSDSIHQVRLFSRGTTHVSVCDAHGNAASMTTSNGEGSGYVVPGTGIMLNNMLGEDDLHPQGFHTSPPGLRVASMMAPSILLRDGEVRLVLGSGGSKRIRTALLQVISNSVDFDMDLHQAIVAPRLHWDGEQIQLEPGFPPASQAALAQRWPVNAWPESNMYFGGVHAVSPSAGQAAGDPRRGGFATSAD
ncbi:MAG: gamma-glutamyltransferase [Gammaproteobacteria bacterium]